MARKSNKTAHVLNLLAGGQMDSEPPEQQEPEHKKKAPLNISLIDPSSTSDPLSSLIRDTLDKEVILSESGSAVEESREVPPGQTIPSAALSKAPEDDGNIDMAQASADLDDDKFAKAETRDNSPSGARGEALDGMHDSSTAAETNTASADLISEETDETPEELTADTSLSAIENQLKEAIKTEILEKEPAVSPQKILPAEEMAVAEAPRSEMPVNPVSDVKTGGKAAEAEASKPMPISASEPIPEFPLPAETVPETAATAIPETVSATAAEEEYKYINMMDIIVEERLLEFMNRFNVCTCKRCVADTKALALNNLPPKYIVTPIASISPLLSFYRNKYNIYVVTELTKACLVVLDHPRH